MGQSKGGGYTQKDIFSGDVNNFLQQILGQASSNTEAAAEGFRQFLPGGGGGQAITNQANKNFQQNTIPSILNAFGRGNKGSSSLNNALAAGAADLNTGLASQLAQMQQSAAQGLGSLGINQSQIGAQPRQAYLQTQPSTFQSILQSVLGAGGQAASGWASGGFKT